MKTFLTRLRFFHPASLHLSNVTATYPGYRMWRLSEEAKALTQHIFIQQ